MPLNSAFKSAPRAADWETLVNEGIEARKLGDMSNWRLGELAAQVETHYGEGDLAKYGQRIGVAFNSLREYRRVSERFENAIRIANLSWAHLRVLAAREDELAAAGAECCNGCKIAAARREP